MRLIDRKLATRCQTRTFRVNFYGIAGLGKVCCSFVVEYSIPIDPYTISPGRGYHLDQLSLGTPFRSDGILLLELAKVIQIVDIVAIASMPAPFTPWGNPHVVYADRLQRWHLGSKAGPMLLVFGAIPFEGLKHGQILWAWLVWTGARRVRGRRGDIGVR